MFRNARVQMAAVLAVGVLLGYVAASGRFNPFQRAGAADPSDGSAQAGDGDKPDCGCSDGLSRGQLLAKADEKEGKNSDKPNILFIMGDDIGWMQPSCYHRGLMVGEMPNIDRIAKEGLRSRLFSPPWCRLICRVTVLPWLVALRVYW